MIEDVPSVDKLSKRYRGQSLDVAIFDPSSSQSGEFTKKLFRVPDVSISLTLFATEIDTDNLLDGAIHYEVTGHPGSVLSGPAIIIPILDSHDVDFSERSFDVAFAPVDKRELRIARSVGGISTFFMGSLKENRQVDYDYNSQNYLF